MSTTDEKIFIGVVGAGTMGAGIAQVAATAGHPVFIFDPHESAIERAKISIMNSLKKIKEKDPLENYEPEEIFLRIQFVDEVEKLSACRFIIEAVVEELSIKQKVFAELEKIISTESILATNTSSLSVTSIASSLKNSERFIAAHFFNPAALIPLIEIVPAFQTSSETINQTKAIINSWGKTTVICKDTPGFIVNRIARPFYGEALRILEEGIADAATIDYAMKKIGGFKMGPFELMDLIGNDVNYKVTETVFSQMYFDPRYKPSIIQKRMVDANLLGRKTGKGFYDYNQPALNPQPLKDENTGEEIFFRILSMLINEAAETVYLKIASVEDIDLAMTRGVNYPKGLLRWADEIGIEKVVNKLQSLFDEYNEERYRTSTLLKKMIREKKKFYNE